jgi:hypothetical protein
MFCEAPYSCNRLHSGTHYCVAIHRSKVISQRLPIIAHFTWCTVEYNCKPYRLYVSNCDPFVGRGYVTASNCTLTLVIHINKQTNKQTNTCTCNDSKSLGQDALMSLNIFYLPWRLVIFSVNFLVKMNAFLRKCTFCFCGALKWI